MAEGTKVVTGKVRLSYVNIFTPRKTEGQEKEKYSVTLLIQKSDTATMGKIRAAMEAAKVAGVEKWGGKAPKNIATPLYDGDGFRPNGEEFGEECKDCFVITAGSEQKPGIVDKDLNAILDTSEVYSGCYGRVSINFFAYDKAGKKGIGCGLNNVQKLADGEPLSGRSRAEDDFADTFEDDAAEDLLG